MKVMKYAGFALALLMVTTAAALQNPDPANNIFPQVSVSPRIHTNSADVGNVVDRQGYAGAMWTLVQGHVTNGAGAASYMVLQDSSVTPAQVWTAVDSIVADTVDNKVQTSKSYTGNKRFLRLIQRANSASTDTTFVTDLITLTGKRTKP